MAQHPLYTLIPLLLTLWYSNLSAAEPADSALTTIKNNVDVFKCNNLLDFEATKLRSTG